MTRHVGRGRLGASVSRRIGAGDRIGRRLAAPAVATLLTLGACGSDAPEFVEPNGVVIWSVDDTPAVLPADSPADGNPQMFVDELRNAAVVGGDGERIVVVGDRYDHVPVDGATRAVVDDPGRDPEQAGAPGVRPDRFAYLLEADGRVVHMLGVLDGDSDLRVFVPGRRVGAGLDAAATTAYVTTSIDIREVPVLTDPATGQVFAIYDARDGETLHRLDAYDAAGRLTDSVDVAPPD